MSKEGDIRIKDYQIHLPPLGEGTYGRVYRATYRGISERALKIFKPGAVDLSTMARELEKLSSVAEHRGIVTLHDFDLLNAPRYYAMGLHADHSSEGDWETRTLEKLCGHVDHRVGLRLIRDIADALAYLHRHQIVHCDVKPSNILLTDETPYRIKICDFGQSRGNAAEDFQVVGTPLYASPEQLRSPRESADGKGFRWDVYSFGVVAFKLLTGKLPRLQVLAEAERKSFDPDATLVEASLEATLADDDSTLDGDRLATMTEAVEDIEWPSDLYIPTARRELIEQCLALDPTERPADMREVMGKIQEIDQLLVVRRARRLNAIFGTLLVIAIWASGFAFVQARKAEASSRDAEELALIIVNELNRREFSGSGMDQLYSVIADHSETFLANLPKDHRRSEKTLRLSAQTASLRGRQALERGELDEALSRYTNAFEIRSQLASNLDQSNDLAMLASRDLMEIGKVHELNNDYPAATASYQTALEWRKNSIDDTKMAPLQKLKELAATFRALARVNHYEGKEKDAMSNLSEILAMFSEESATASPEEKPLYTREIINIMETLGKTQYESGNLPDAAETYQELITTSESLQSDSQSYREEARETYTTAINALGKIQMDQGQSEAALVLFREEIKIRERASEMRPYDPDLKLSLADAYAMASTCLDTEDATGRSLAVFYLEQSLDLISKLPPDLRNDDNTQEKTIAYNDLLSNLLEMDE